MGKNNRKDLNTVAGKIVPTGSLSDRSFASSVLLAAYDIVAVVLSYFAALLTRFDFSFGSIPEEFLKVYYRYILFYAVFCFVIFLLLKLYRSIWKFASMIEMARILAATLITCAVPLYLQDAGILLSRGFDPSVFPGRRSAIRLPAGPPDPRTDRQRRKSAQGCGRDDHRRRERRTARAA